MPKRINLPAPGVIAFTCMDMERTISWAYGKMEQREPFDGYQKDFGISLMGMGLLPSLLSRRALEKGENPKI